MVDKIEEINDSGLSQKMKGFWLRALSAVELDNHEYAVSLCQAILKDCPGFLDGRKLARKCATYEGGIDKGKKTSAMTAFLGSGGGFSAAKVRSTIKSDPEAALPMLEVQLSKDPYNPQMNELLFESAMRLNMLDTAAFGLETVRTGAPSNTKLLHKLADHYLARDMPSKAVAVYNDIIARDPTDMDAQKGSKDASARASMKKAKKDESDEYTLQKKDKDEVVDLQQDDVQGMTREQMRDRLSKLMDEYTADQNNLPVVKKIAALYEEMGYAPDSYVFYSWAHELSDNDISLKNKASLMKKKMEDEEFRSVEREAKSNPDDEAIQAKHKKAKGDRLDKAVAECQTRVDANPTDPSLRFDLGFAMSEKGEYSDAIPHLQQASRNPHIRTRSLLLLAQTFKAKSMFDLAIKQLQDALEDLHTMDDVKKQVLYEKGLIHIEMEDKVKALESFKEIYEVDYGYRDVAKKVESSYGA